jgi:hypothetical protein
MSDTQKSQKITLEQAEAVSVEPPKTDGLAHKEKDFFAHEENMQNAQLGWIGRFWGAKTEKPGNVSALIALILSIYLGVLIFCIPQSDRFDDVFAGLTSVITLILGYLFGSSDRNS